MSVKCHPQSPVDHDKADNLDTLAPVGGKFRPLSPKEMANLNESQFQSYYADMPEDYFHQMMTDYNFFVQEFRDPVFEISNASILGSTIDPLSSCNLNHTNKDGLSSDIGHITKNNPSQSINIIGNSCQSPVEDPSLIDNSDSEYYSCDSDDASVEEGSSFEHNTNEVNKNEVNAKLVLNHLYELTVSPAAQSPFDFVIDKEHLIHEVGKKGAEVDISSIKGIAVEGDTTISEANDGTDKWNSEITSSLREDDPLEIDSYSFSYVHRSNLEDESIPGCVFDEGVIWSVLTDNIQYQGERFNTIKLQRIQEYDIDPKILHFNADNNNVPDSIPNHANDDDIIGIQNLFITDPEVNTESPSSLTNQTSKEQFFLAANCNEPKQGIHQRYDVKPSVITREQFDPNTCVTATYLWSEHNKSAMKVSSNHFDMGIIPMNLYSELAGHLLDNTRVRVLIDSGATKSLLSKEFYDRNPILHGYPRYKINPRGIKTAGKNAKVLPVTECVNLIIKLRGHVFLINAYIVPDMCEEYDFILGQKTMYELEAGPNFGTLNFSFVQRSLPLYTDQNINIEPGQAQTVKLRIKNCPREFKHGEVICNLKTSENHGSVQTILLPVRNRKVIVKMENETSTMWKIPLGGICGSADMRSVGYFHIDRDILHKLMMPHCAFLNEHETETYFKMVMDELHKMCETGTRLNHEVQSPISPKDVNKSQDSDPYPWLEKDDPRRKMTDEQILRKYVDLKDSDLSDCEKEQLYKMLLKHKKAFSLRDEIGLCPNMEVKLELTDKRPFFIRHSLAVNLIKI